MGRLDGKVVFVTGAARGQGRAICARMAVEGADVVAVDSLSDVATVRYPMATSGDLAETVALVEKAGRRIVARQADVRDFTGLQAVVDEGLQAFGHLDVVCANAGIASFGPTWELSEQSWQDMIDINLTGAWHTIKATVPSMISAGRGGSIIITSSTAGLKGMANIAHYTAAKHGLVGLMRTLANEVAPHSIRVNTVHPTNVATDMILNDSTFRLFRPDITDPTQDDMIEAMSSLNALPVPWVEADDVANAALFLASDEARYITGVALPVDAGCVIK
ncbi:MAG: mycofactocin-coupled SDR family oxidoreductase [Actinomycetota bacterium]|nr:mycofactocin-coupled SDR family oxidoreductase [Actinomycetota bacterium]